MKAEFVPVTAVVVSLCAVKPNYVCVPLFKPHSNLIMEMLILSLQEWQIR